MLDCTRPRLYPISTKNYVINSISEFHLLLEPKFSDRWTKVIIEFNWIVWHKKETQITYNSSKSYTLGTRKLEKPCLTFTAAHQEKNKIALFYFSCVKINDWCNSLNNPWKISDCFSLLKIQNKSIEDFKFEQANPAHNIQQKYWLSRALIVIPSISLYIKPSILNSTGIVANSITFMMTGPEIEWGRQMIPIQYVSVYINSFF